jgi:hypothetical protein
MLTSSQTLPLDARISHICISPLHNKSNKRQTRGFPGINPTMSRFRNKN